MLKRLLGKIHLDRLSVVNHATVPEAKLSRKEGSVEETAKNSTTSGSTLPEAWLVSGLLLSLVTPIVFASLRTRAINDLGLNDPKERNL
jgi:hypothetical protein